MNVELSMAPWDGRAFTVSRSTVSRPTSISFCALQSLGVETIGGMGDFSWKWKLNSEFEFDLDPITE